MEDFQQNKFFAAMRHLFPDLENEAISRSWTLLIPQSTSIQAAKFTTKSIIFSHILQPLNQYYPGFFLTLNGKSVKFNQEEKSLKACDKVSDAGGAFLEERTVYILFEEEFFVGNSSFKVYCINRPIIGPGEVVLSPYDNKELFSPDRLAKDWVLMLKRSRENKFVIESALAFAAGINEQISSGKCMLVVRNERPKDGTGVGLVDDKPFCVERSVSMDAFNHLIEVVNEECHILVEQSIKRNANFSCALKQNPLFELLANAFHTTIHEELYPNVFSAICNVEMEAENQLQIKVHIMRTHGSSEVDCDKCVGLDLEKTAVNELRSINNERSPLAKLDVIVQVGTLIAASFNAFQEKVDAKAQTEETGHRRIKSRRGSLATDELLPMYIYVVLQAAPGLLLANISYMKTFAPRETLNDKYGFYLATFESAIRYIQENTMDIGTTTVKNVGECDDDPSMPAANDVGVTDVRTNSDEGMSRRSDYVS
jgi:hypothetical protein